MLGLSRRERRDRAAARRIGARRRALRPWMDGLEDRVVLSTIAWTGNAGTNDWNTAANWFANQLPGPSDTADIGYASVVVSSNASVGSLVVGNGGGLKIQGGATFNVNSGFDNVGTVEINGGNSVFTVSGANQYNNKSSGWTVLEDGGKLNAGSVINAGKLGGVGTINTDVTNNGEVIPGMWASNDAGTLLVIGNYTQNAAGSLTSYISGPNQITGYGRLNVKEKVTLSGALDVTILNGYDPVGGTFNVLGFDERSGSFGQIVPHNLAPGVSAFANYTNTGGSDNLSVRFELPSSITVSPSSTTIAKGETANFTATGHYANGPDADLTSNVAWTSSNVAVAMITGPGAAKGVGQGDAEIKATLGAIHGEANLHVDPAALVSIAVNPGETSVAKGLTASFTATGTYTDDSTDDITGSVVWTSLNPTIASIVGAGQAKGLLVGDAVVKAALNGKENTATLHVTAAELVSIAIGPVSATTALGSHQSYAAWGTYTDDSTDDITGSVVWNSSDENVATISGAGDALALAIGQTTITASLGGVFSNAATLNVQAAVVATSISWGTSGTANLLDADGGTRLLPEFRANTIGWYGIKQIHIDLGVSNTTLALGDVSVVGQVGGPLGFSLSQTETGWLITLTSPIEDADRITITVGNAEVATYSRRLDVLPGDVNDDGVVTMQDAVLVRNGITGFQPIVEPLYFLDILGDGEPTLAGYNTVRRFLGKRLPPLT